MNHVLIFRTGILWEIDMAREKLKEAEIPHFVQEETLSGIRTAFLATPASGVGITWKLMVPEIAVNEAKEILEQLPIDLNKNPGFWDFTTNKNVIKGTKIYAWIILILLGITLTMGLIQIINELINLNF